MLYILHDTVETVIHFANIKKKEPKKHISCTLPPEVMEEEQAHMHTDGVYGNDGVGEDDIDDDDDDDDDDDEDTMDLDDSMLL